MFFPPPSHAPLAACARLQAVRGLQHAQQPPLAMPGMLFPDLCLPAPPLRSASAQAVEIALRRTEKALQQERHSTETAEKAAAAAEKKLEK